MTAVPERLAVALSDRYRLVRELGAGGMATVYLAHDLKHDRQVALKVLRPELAAVIGAERFVVEIKTTAQLQHPHILPLFDSGTATVKGHGSRVTGPDGGKDLDDAETRDPRPATFLYYVMPYIDGETLRAKLDRETQFGVDEAVRITVAVADALDYAHRHGVIHRDIKPENILLHDGRPMVADFGIALALSAAAGGRLTETGMSLGTPHYMSPEQATADKELTGRSDIYSLGSVLYEMLAGQPPHLGGSAQQIIMKIIAEPVPPVTAFRKSVPPNVAAAVAKSLEKLPADRFETAMAFGNALLDREFTIPGTAAIGALPPLGRRRAPLLVVGAVAVLAAALAAWGWFRPTARPAASRLRVALTTHPIAPGHVGRGLALSPDGATIVFADSVDGTPRLWIKTADQADPKPLAGTEGADAATFSPDGRWIAFIADGKVRKIPVAGGAPVTIADSAAGAGGSNIPPAVAWLDDDSVLYVDRGFGLRIAGQDGGRTRRFDYLGTVGLGIATIAPLRGGRTALLGMCDFGCPSARLFVVDLATGKLDSLVDGAVRGWQLADGRIVFARLDGGVFIAPYDARHHRFAGTPVPALDGVRTVQYWPDIAVAANGTLLYIPGPASGGNTLSEVEWMTRDGRATPVDPGWTIVPSVNGGVRLSPDGRRLALAVVSEGHEEVWIKQLDHGPFTRLTLEGPGLRGEWSADGRSIYYFRVGGANNSDLRRRWADGTGEAEVLLHATRAVWEVQFPRDTTRLIVRLGVPPSRDIYLFDRAKGHGDSAISPLIADDRYEEDAIALSPDGRWLAYTSNESGRSEVYVRPFPEVNAGRWQVSATGGGEPRWAHSGRELFYRRADGYLMSVPITQGGTFEQGAQRALFPASPFLSNTAYTMYDIAPGDQRFVFLRPIVPTLGEGANTVILVQHWLTDVDARHAENR